MNQEAKYEFTSNEISRFWNILNNSNDVAQKQIANTYFNNLKEKCSNYLDISIELFDKSNSVQDKIISSLLIYQYIKENYKAFIENKILFNKTKDFLINKTLILFSNESEQNIFESSENYLIIERICYSISLILIIGCLSYWPEAVDEMLLFGKQTIKHTYLATIIFGNCYEELTSIFLNKKKENIIKQKFVIKKEEFKSFINTILISKNIHKKLYNKTIFLSKNLAFFEVNTLQIPNMIKTILENINISNIDSFTKLITKCIEFSKGKKLEDELSGLDLSEYDKRMNKDESMSLNLIIEYIYLYVRNNTNNYDKEVLFGFGSILSEIIENYIYLLFKKDTISQKLLNLFFFFITNKSKIISQLFFESLLVMKNFINVSYKFGNYSQNEKVDFSNFLLKICQSIITNCRYSKIENRDILLNGDNLDFKYNKEENKNNDNCIKKEEDGLDEIDEIPIVEFRNNAEDTIFNIFSIFAVNFNREGVNYFFESITKEIIPLLQKKIEEITNEQILTIESIIYGIKSVANCFEALVLDRTPLIKFILFIARSQLINNEFVFCNFLLLIEEAASFFDDNNIYSQIISFLLYQIELRLNQPNQINLVQMTTVVLLSICESSENIYINNLWEKMFNAYKKYYDQYNEKSLFNLTEAICSSLILQEEDKYDMDDLLEESDEEKVNDNIKKNDNKNDMLSNDLLIKNFIKIVECPLLRIRKIKEIINNKNNSNIFGNKEKEECLKKEVEKNFNVLTRILKQSSFIEDKLIINELFNHINQNSFEDISIIIKEYINAPQIIKYILKMLTKSSFHLSIQIVDKIFNQFNELMINIFMNNNEHYQSIYVLKNIYSIKLKNLSDKTIGNNSYTLILNNFIKINSQMKSAILSNCSSQQELIQCLSILFSNIYPYLQNLRKEDCVVIIDILNLFIECIKTISENNIIKSILFSFICFVNSKKNEIINVKFNDIVKNAFYGIEHYNNIVIDSFNNFCFCCINYDKVLFLSLVKDILNSKEFSCFNDKYKNVIIDYFDYYYKDINKLKNIVIDMMNVIKKKNVQDIFDVYYQELRMEKKDYLKIKNLKNIVVNIE